MTENRSLMQRLFEPTSLEQQAPAAKVVTYALLFLWSLVVLVPLYWVLHSIAALLAARELIVTPTSWAKTTHGVTRMARTGAIQRGAEALRPRIG